MDKLKIRVWDGNKMHYDIQGWGENNSFCTSIFNDNWISGEPNLFSTIPDISTNDIYEGDVLSGKYIVRFGEFDNKQNYANNKSGIGFYLEKDGKCEYSLTTFLVNALQLKVTGNVYQDEKLFIYQ